MKVKAEKKQPITKPSSPNLPMLDTQISPTPLTQEAIRQITSVRIHPGIGIARLGNSAEYYLAPEVSNPPLTPFGANRDAQGALKRQAARFRIYGYDAAGKVVCEVPSTSNSQVSWRVQVANKKAAWYQFDAAMDIPATATLTVQRRNADVKGADRNHLIIDSGIVPIVGINQKGKMLAGRFITGDTGTSVQLGELRTDESGRLLVLPGLGKSASPTGKPVYDSDNPISFNNADGWYDDIADGPVFATVTINGQIFEADSAWVASAPPNYAPDVIGWRTMDDLLQNIYIKAGMLALPSVISFQDHVRPILARLSGLQWVNQGYLAMFGSNAPLDFSRESLLKQLSDTSDVMTYKALRRTVYNNFRSETTLHQGIVNWPWNYGDTYGYNDNLPETYQQMPDYYDYILSNWVAGNFVNTPATHPTVYESLENAPLQAQPELLDRAAMHFCLADAFHPGAELTWPMRHISMYRAPYRIKLRPAGTPEPDAGSTLTQAKVLKVGGILYEQGAGDLSKWMAIPWQGDTAFCRSGYDPDYDPYLPTFWPARVPNQVLTLEAYKRLCDKTLDMAARIAAFQTRAFWLRQFPNGIVPAMEYMVKHFGDIGILEALPRPDDMDWLPEQLYIENLSTDQTARLGETDRLLADSLPTMTNTEKALAEAGWASEAQRLEFINVKRRGR